MQSLIVIILFIAAVLLIGYGINKWFDFKTHQGKEGSNSTVKRALGVLLIGFLTLVGLAPFFADLVVQVLNNVFGLELKGTQSSELIGMVAFLFFCISIVTVIYFYYRNRHRLYLNDISHKPKETKSTKTKITKRKNIISNSKIDVKGDFRLGDDINK